MLHETTINFLADYACNLRIACCFMESLINFIQVVKLAPVENPFRFLKFYHVSNNLFHLSKNSCFSLALYLALMFWAFNFFILFFFKENNIGLRIIQQATLAFNSIRFTINQALKLVKQFRLKKKELGLYFEGCQTWMSLLYNYGIFSQQYTTGLNEVMESLV